METIRSFIAVELSDEARTALADVQNQLKAVMPPNTVRWTNPKNIHLTLHFLGNITTDDVARVTEILQAGGSGWASFSLTIDGLGCFPNMGRPRIVWVGVSGETTVLGDIHRNLGKKLAVIDFTPDSRPYSPHLTIGRVKKGVRSGKLRQLGEVLEQEQAKVGQLATLNVTEISLMRSDLKPTGPLYTQLARGVLKD